MNDLKIVYTASTGEKHLKELETSLISLNKFVDKDNIQMIFNPCSPSEKKIHKFNKYGQVIIGDDYYQKLKLNNLKFKIEPLDTKSENLIFLDVDTVIKKDITDLLNDDYDFYGRPEPFFTDHTSRYVQNLKWYEDNWLSLLNKYGCPKNAVAYNSGFIIFKNRTHNKIRKQVEEIFKLLYEKKHPYPHSGYPFHCDEFAISISTSPYNCKLMTKDEHLFAWKEAPCDSYVIHTGH